ncbi:hypothetical protein GGR55DRAFT_667218 [Xylaria sp. FL0064]|nr:hypothetical protein GGR55DRAFT_667218 [Xylaria sp. FL0064]
MRLVTMYIFIILSALSAVAACGLTSRNSNTAVGDASAGISIVDNSPSPEEIATTLDDDTLEVDKKKPKGPPHIPVKMMKCMGHNMTSRRQDWLYAKENLTTWSLKKGNYVSQRTYYAETWPCPNILGVTWYICNCKSFHADKVPQWELDEVQRLLGEKCGPWQSGWVWSQRWQKGYNVVPSEWYIPRNLYYEDRHRGQRLCPHNCV